MELGEGASAALHTFVWHYLRGERHRRRGGYSSKASPTELACRAAAGIEAKTRKMEEKLKKHKESKWLFMRIISRILLSSAGCVGTIVTLVFDYCSGLSLQNLATLVLVGYVSAPTVKPWVKLLLSKLSSMMLH